MASVDAIIAMGGQPTTPLLNPLEVAEARYKIQEIKDAQASQNVLKALLNDPQNIDPNTGMLNQLAQMKYTKAVPAAGMAYQQEAAKVGGELALSQERQQAANLKLDTYVQSMVRSPALNAYDDAIKNGKSPEAAQDVAQRAYDEGLDELKKSGLFSSQQIEQFNPQFDQARVRARAHANDLQNQKGWDIVSDPTTGQQYRLNKYTGEARDLQNKPYTPGGAERLRGGTARSGIAQYLQDWRAQYLQQHGKPPPAREEASAMADYYTNIAGGTAAIKADAQSLANITKINDASVAFENTAIKNFEMAEKLMADAKKAGKIPDMGPWVNKWVEQGEAMFGDPTIPPLVLSALTGANEYAKVMAGSTGSQGSTVDSRKEARDVFNPYFNTGQFGPLIDVAKRDMDNKKLSYQGQIEEIKGRIAGERGAAGGGGGAGGAGGGKGGGTKGKTFDAAVSLAKAHPEYRQMFIDHYGKDVADQYLGQ